MKVIFLKKNSLPLDCRRGFLGDIIDHAVDSLDFGHDALRHLEKEFPGQFHHLSGDGIHAVDGADGDNVVIASAAVPDPGGFDGNKDGESLPGFGIPAGFHQFFSDDGIGFPEHGESIP